MNFIQMSLFMFMRVRERVKERKKEKKSEKKKIKMERFLTHKHITQNKK